MVLPPDDDTVKLGSVSISTSTVRWLANQLPGGVLMLVVLGMMLWGAFHLLPEERRSFDASLVADREAHAKELQALRDDCNRENDRLHAKIDELHGLLAQHEKNQEAILRALDELKKGAGKP